MMKLQECFLELEQATEELKSTVEILHNRAGENPPDPNDYLVRHFTEKSIDLLSNINDSIQHAKNGAIAAEKPDVVKANKKLEEYEKCLGQVSETFSSQVDRCKMYTDLEDKKESDKEWKAYAPDLLVAIEQAQKSLRSVWTKFKVVNRELREQSTISLSNPLLIRADDFIPESFQHGIQDAGIERFYNMLSSEEEIGADGMGENGLL